MIVRVWPPCVKKEVHWYDTPAILKRGIHALSLLLSFWLYRSLPGTPVMVIRLIRSIWFANIRTTRSVTVLALLTRVGRPMVARQRVTLGHLHSTGLFPLPFPNNLLHDPRAKSHTLETFCIVCPGSQLLAQCFAIINVIGTRELGCSEDSKQQLDPSNTAFVTK